MALTFVVATMVVEAIASGFMALLLVVSIFFSEKKIKFERQSSYEETAKPYVYRKSKCNLQGDIIHESFQLASVTVFEE